MAMFYTDYLRMAAPWMIFAYMLLQPRYTAPENSRRGEACSELFLTLKPADNYAGAAYDVAVHSRVHAQKCVCRKTGAADIGHVAVAKLSFLYPDELISASPAWRLFSRYRLR